MTRAFFSLASSGYPRWLHPFPTRRSSDLRARSTPTCTPKKRPAAPAGAHGPIARAAITRSEEHTSELQSHHELVCRLLLEKKKSRKTPVRDRANKLELLAPRATAAAPILR